MFNPEATHPTYRRFVTILLILAISSSAALYHVDPRGTDAGDGSAGKPFRSPGRASTFVKPGDTVLIHAGTYEMNEQIVISCKGTAAAPVFFTGPAGAYPVFNFGAAIASTGRDYNSGFRAWLRVFRPQGGRLPGPVRRASFFRGPGRGMNRGFFDWLVNQFGADLRARIPLRMPPQWVVPGPRGGVPGAMVVFQSSHVRIAGIAVVNSPSVGILGRESDHVTVSACSTYNTFSSGISAWDCTDYAIEKNRIVLACNHGSQECVSISRTHRYRVTGNEISNTTRESSTGGGEGIDCKEGSSHGVVAENHLHHLNRQGLYIDSWRDSLVDVDVYGNVVHDCMSGFDISTEVPPGTVTDVRFHHNLIHDCYMSGVWITTWGSHDGVRRDIRIFNNTIHHNGWSRSMEGSPHGGIYIETENTVNLDIRNNILSDNCAFQIAGLRHAGEKAACAWNLIDGPNTEPFRMNLDSSFAPGADDVHPVNSPADLRGKAVYADPRAGDFHPAKGSAGIDAGDPAAVYNDPDGTRNDIGAFPARKDADAGK